VPIFYWVAGGVGEVLWLLFLGAFIAFELYFATTYIYLYGRTPSGIVVEERFGEASALYNPQAKGWKLCKYSASSFSTGV